MMRARCVLSALGVAAAIAGATNQASAESRAFDPFAAKSHQGLSLPLMWPQPAPDRHGGLPTFGNNLLKYYGGRVISNVHVVQVSWTASVDQNLQQQLPGYYQTITNSTYMDWLEEYDTIGLTGKADGQPGSNQHIGRGDSDNKGAYVITPTVATGTSVTAQSISQEIQAQIQAGSLPQPVLDAGGNVNSIYMIDFPGNYQIELMGAYGCQSFCAFHWTVSINGKSVPIGVHPDVAACPGSCGGTFDDATIVHSHELMEAITDTEAGLANLQAGNARPLAWLGDGGASQEIGDVCFQGFQGNFGKVGQYTVQKVWSNYVGGCVLEVPICAGGSTPPSCRPCKAADNGGGCQDPNSACATSGPKQGQCVPCTTDYSKGCTGATPVCDSSNNTCVGCLQSGDCGDKAAPVCDTNNKTCMPCTSDSQCNTGNVCDTSTDSMHGRCVQCNQDSQCPSGNKCVPTTHDCQPSVADGGSWGNNNNGGSANPDDLGVSPGCGCETVGSNGSSIGALVVGIGVAIAAARKRRRA